MNFNVTRGGKVIKTYVIDDKYKPFIVLAFLGVFGLAIALFIWLCWTAYLGLSVYFGKGWGAISLIVLLICITKWTVTHKTLTGKEYQVEYGAPVIIHAFALGFLAVAFLRGLFT